MTIMCVDCGSPCTNDLEDVPLTEDQVTLIQERVTAGMTWLDEHFPDHVRQFDADSFDIMNKTKQLEDGAWVVGRCVLIQATNTDYWLDAKMKAGLLPLETIDLGFCPDLDDVSYPVYNRLWLAAYAERKAALVG